MIKSVFRYLMVTVIIITAFSIKQVFAQSPIVRAILFYSPTCQACEQVKTGVFPFVNEKYGNQFQLLQIDTSFDEGLKLYESAVTSYKIPQERLGVPTLIIGETILVGAIEIPQQLPIIIEKGLRSGGIEWPDFPGLRDLLITQGLVIQDTPTSTQTTGLSAQTPDTNTTGAVQNPIVDTPSPNISGSSVKSTESDVGPGTSLESTSGTPSTVNIPITTISNSSESEGIFNHFLFKFNQDRSGNSLAVIVLLFMLVSVYYVGYEFIRGKPGIAEKWPVYVVPVLSLIGLFAATYLSFVEFTRSEAVCGPIGDCNTVQESPYAYLFGFIPVGLFGILGYLVILVTWLVGRFGNITLKKYSAILIWIMAWFGVLFSIYLTFLEPFVIGATCAWCITSAIVMTFILVASTPQVVDVLSASNPEVEPDLELDGF